MLSQTQIIKSKVKVCYWFDFVTTFDKLNESQIHVDNFFRAVMTMSACAQVNIQKP